MVTRYEGIIFDLGGVVIDWNPRHLYRRVFSGDENKIDWFLSVICPMEWNEKQDAGRKLQDGIAERVSLFPEWSEEIHAYYEQWIEMIGGAVPGTGVLLGELAAAGVRLFALSNWSTETFPLVADRFDELRLFERIFLSGDLRVAKPDARCYLAALKEIDVPPERLVFVDDNPRNVLAAESVGLQGIVFRSADTLRQDLKRPGLHNLDSART